MFRIQNFKCLKSIISRYIMLFILWLSKNYFNIRLIIITINFLLLGDVTMVPEFEGVYAVDPSSAYIHAMEAGDTSSQATGNTSSQATGNNDGVPEDIDEINKKTKKKLEFYQETEKNLRSLNEFLHDFKDDMKISNKQRNLVCEMIGMNRKDLDDAIKDKDIEALGFVRSIYRKVWEGNKIDINKALDERLRYIRSKGFNPDDYPYR
uniref:Uncharacterized protein n=1 Tax=Heterodermia speciosa TaxID=116794 RepID=A0A3G2Z7C7_9LECA|nr:hypothetical protein EJ567_mgp17 [Heterodermia speciosa]AYP35442.1 hypothetical protein [Heterodermia speciosa]